MNMRGGSFSRRGGEWSGFWDPSGETRKYPLIKVSTIRKDELLGDRIEELPPFVLNCVAHKDCLFHV
jgi:hypothetical protein